jgi:hypothetical protein
LWPVTGRNFPCSLHITAINNAVVKINVFFFFFYEVEYIKEEEAGHQEDGNQQNTGKKTTENTEQTLSIKESTPTSQPRIH